MSTITKQIATQKITFITDKKTDADWFELKKHLLEPNNELYWLLAYNDFFYGRIYSRYLNPISKLQPYDEYCGYGFTIMAINCSLIEFLESTYKGKKYRYCKDKELTDHEYNKSKDCFLDFLLSKQPFKECFKDRKIAEIFYSDIRCGLLHEATTKNGWRIWADSDSGNEIIDKKNQIVFRNDFSAAIKKYMAIYRDELITNTELQANFIRKFDWICE